MTPSGMNNGRNPTKKRGRPPLEGKTVHQLRDEVMATARVSRNVADAINAIDRGLHPDRTDEWVSLLDTGETTFTILSYVSRYPHDQQPMMFDLFQKIGSRAAKRWVENQMNPPSPEAIALRVVKWIGREFPNVAVGDVVEGIDMAGAMFATSEQPAETPTRAVQAAAAR